MAHKLYLYLLIVCGFLCSGITASLSPNNTRKSADFLVRNKRVINHAEGGNTLARIGDIGYIVNIRQNSYLHCIGTILSRFTAITASHCILLELSHYQLQSGSAYSHRSTKHTLLSMSLYYGNHPSGVYDGIALLKVDPPFALGQNIVFLRMHVEPVVPGTMALVSGWGCNHPTAPSMPGQQKLRSITLPIMNHRECRATYANRFAITEKHICTYDELKLCAIYDLGTPLVINNFLVGIHIFKGVDQGVRNPDIFLDVQRSEYSVWIRENTQY